MGMMQIPSRRLAFTTGDSPSPTLPVFLDESLRGVGQVVFCNSAGSGALMLAALCKGDPWLGTLAATGTMTATIAAKMLQLDQKVCCHIPLIVPYSAGMTCSCYSADTTCSYYILPKHLRSQAVANGLVGYNGCLVGCAFSVFLGFEPWSLGGAVSTMAVAALTAPLTVPLKAVCGSVPQWTLAFNLATLSVLAYTKPLAGLAAVPTDTTITLMEWLYAPLLGVSQIFVVQDHIAGAMILGAIGFFSPACAGFTLVGSTLGMAVGLALGAPSTDIVMGLWGFNPALTSLAVSVFFVPSAPMYALAGSGALTTAILFGSIKGGMATVLGTPALTLPFCMVATACHMAPWLGLPGITHARLPHSPEKNDVK